MSETLPMAENQAINEHVARLHEKLRKKYETSFASRQDGKKVPYVSIGDPDGMPVFLIPGSPGSRLGPFPKAKWLFRNDIWLLSFDRSGYGLAPREPGRTLQDVVKSIIAIADHEDIEKFCVAGRSGGGPFALACAAYEHDRTIAAALIAAPSPKNRHPETEWHKGIVAQNTEAFALSRQAPEQLAARYDQRAKQVNQNPSWFLDTFLEPQLTDTERRALNNYELRRDLTLSYSEAFRSGNGGGWLDDTIGEEAYDEIDLGLITQPVLLWGGLEDRFVPPGNIYDLANALPNSIVEIEEAKGHFDAFEATHYILNKLVAVAEQELQG